MKVTIETIKDNFPSATKINQIGAKQLFTCTINGCNYLISYKTVVGIIVDDVWMLTPHKHSRTTSKQLTVFSYDNPVKIASVKEWMEISLNNLHKLN